jgi:hypothetical protein
LHTLVTIRPWIPVTSHPYRPPTGEADGYSQTRDGNGRFTHSYTTAQRDAQAAELRDEGWTLQAIADDLGYHDRTHAKQGIRRAIEKSSKSRPNSSSPAKPHAWTPCTRRPSKSFSASTSPCPTAGHQGRRREPPPRRRAEARRDRPPRQVRESYRKLLGLDAPSRVSVDAQQLGDEISALLNRATADDDNST